jgi:hypothetical protein
MNDGPQTEKEAAEQCLAIIKKANGDLCDAIDRYGELVDCHPQEIDLQMLAVTQLAMLRALSILLAIAGAKAETSMAEWLEQDESVNTNTH